VKDAIADEDLDVAVVHDHRDRDLGFADGLPEDLVEPGVEAQLLGRDVEARHHLVERIAAVDSRRQSRRGQPGELLFRDFVHGLHSSFGGMPGFAKMGLGLYPSGSSRLLLST
jgi:hypothetical protein